MNKKNTEELSKNSSWLKDWIDKGSYVIKANFSIRSFSEFPVFGEVYKKFRGKGPIGSEKEKKAALNEAANNREYFRGVARIDEGNPLHISDNSDPEKTLCCSLGQNDEIIYASELKGVYNPLEEEPELYIKFANLDPGNRLDIIKFIARYGSLGYIDLNYYFIDVWEEPQKGGGLWFEPFEWFRQKLLDFKQMINAYKELRKLESKINGSDYLQKTAPEERSKDSYRALELAETVTRILRHGLRGTFNILMPGSPQPGAFQRGYSFVGLHQALYLQFYEAVINERHIKTCPGCKQDFEGRENQIYCNLTCKYRENKRNKKAKEEAALPQKEKTSPRPKSPDIQGK